MSHTGAQGDSGFHDSRTNSGINSKVRVFAATSGWLRLLEVCSVRFGRGDINQDDDTDKWTSHEIPHQFGHSCFGHRQIHLLRNYAYDVALVRGTLGFLFSQGEECALWIDLTKRSWSHLFNKECDISVLTTWIFKNEWCHVRTLDPKPNPSIWVMTQNYPSLVLFVVSCMQFLKKKTALSTSTSFGGIYSCRMLICAED